MGCGFGRVKDAGLCINCEAERWLAAEVGSPRAQARGQEGACVDCGAPLTRGRCEACRERLKIELEIEWREGRQEEVWVEEAGWAGEETDDEEMRGWDGLWEKVVQAAREEEEAALAGD